jgi:poly(beta-D-mannuronate) lyase
MPLHLRLCLIQTIVLMGCGPGLQARGLVHSPWDGHPVTLSDVATNCPVEPDLPADLTTDGFYRKDDPTHSIVDPVLMKAYNESSGPVKSAAHTIVDLADRFRATGSRQAAQCTLRLLAQMAHNETMAGHMSSQQAYYVQGWLAGAMAVAYLKVRESGFDSPAQAKATGQWLGRLGDSTRAWYDAAEKKRPEQNNHLYWAGAEIASIAAVSDRKDLLDWALATYRNGVDQILADGSLPLEMARGQRALHYHLYALTPLVFLAEMGEVNGQDLYAYRDHALARLVAICVHGLSDPSLFEQRTGVKQEVPKNASGDDAWWTKPYATRFPSPQISSIADHAETLSSFYLGGLPPG